MAVALPGAWVEQNLGVGYYFTSRGTVSLKVFNLPAWSSPTTANAVFGSGAGLTYTVAGVGDAVRNIGCPAGSQSQGNRSFTLTYPGGVVTLLGPLTWMCGSDTAPSGIPQWTPEWTYEEIAGPYRLGVRLALIDSLDPPPIFASDLKLEFGWFGDGYTALVQSMAGYTSTRYMNASGGFQALQNTALTPVLLGDTARLFTFQGGTISPIAGDDQIRLTNLSINGGLLDLTGLPPGTPASNRIEGPGALTVLGVASGSGGGGGVVGPPYSVREIVEVADFSRNEMGATVVDADGNERVTPVSVQRSRRNISWPNTEAAFTPVRRYALKSAWATAQDPPLPLTDLYIPAQADPPRTPGVDYLPVTISVAAAVSVHRPDGNTPSSWVSSGAGLTVAEGAVQTTFTVSAAGAAAGRTATRTLSSDWRDRVGLGAGGTANPAFGIEEYERTKHRSGEDVWAWSSHGWLRCGVEGPAGSLALYVTGVYLQITDPHTTGADRITGYVAAEVAWTATYVIPVAADYAEVDVDLLFPTEGGPFYPGRVTSMRLSGFVEGTYRIHRLDLRTPRPAYLKHAPGIEVQRGDYSALGAANGGAFVFGNVPDQTNKPEESGDYGGNPRYVQPITNSATSDIEDEQYSLEDYIAKLNLTEGWSATYDQATHDAAMIDAQGKELTPELAQWMKPLTPYVRIAPGDSYQPECAIHTAQYDIVAGLAFTVPFRKRLWGGLEALVVMEGGRADAGALIGARRVGGSAVEATGETDPDGFAIISPVPANGIVDWELVEV